MKEKYLFFILLILTSELYAQKSIDSIRIHVMQFDELIKYAIEEEYVILHTPPYKD